MGCGGDCGCPQCEGRVPSGHPSVNALEWGLLAGQSRSGASDFWAAATTRAVFSSAVAGMPDADDVRAWVDGPAFASADQSSFADTRYSSMPRGFGRPPPEPPPLPPLPDDDPPTGPGPLPPPRRRRRKPGWLTRDSWSYQRFGLPGPGPTRDWWSFQRLFLQYAPMKAWASMLTVTSQWAQGGPAQGGPARPQKGPQTGWVKKGWWLLHPDFQAMDWVSLQTLRGACCLRNVEIKTWVKTPKVEGTQALVSMGAQVRFTSINNKYQCRCSCCEYRQFVSLRVATPMTEGRNVQPGIDYSADGNIAFEDVSADASADRSKSGLYRILDYSKFGGASAGAIYRMRPKGKPSYVDKWQAVVFKFDTPWGLRYFMEDVVFYWPEHPHALREGSLRGYVRPWSVFKNAPHGITENYLRSIVWGFGRPEPGPAGADRLRSEWLAQRLGRDAYRPAPVLDRMMWTSRDGCTVEFNDIPAWGVAHGTKTAFEIIIHWVPAGGPKCAYSGTRITSPTAGGPLFWTRITWVYDWTTGGVPVRRSVTTGERNKDHFKVDVASALPFLLE